MSKEKRLNKLRLFYNLAQYLKNKDVEEFCRTNLIIQ